MTNYHYDTAKNSLNRITTKKLVNGTWQAAFTWSNGELDSIEDFDDPICGNGNNEAEAIGNLIIEGHKARAT